MRFVRYEYKDTISIGVLSEDESTVISLESMLPVRYEDMVQFIAEAGAEQLDQIKKIVCKGCRGLKTEEVRLLAPIERPIHDILCVGVNYRDHLEETKEKFADSNFQEPFKTVYFSKRSCAISGPGDVIEGRPDLDTKLDYEVELAVIIGKRGKDIPPEEAESYIFGYSVFNDVSARSLQQNHQQWFKGKSLDTFTAMGPCILTKDALPFPIHVDVKSYVNGELRQSSNTRRLIKTVPALIAELSQGMTLEPGDIIATGTPAGVGMGMNPPGYLKAGDVVRVEIPEIGMLENVVKM